MISDAAGRRVLLDASPQYLMCAAAPPRIQAVVPHAKFIMVVRVRPPQCRGIRGFLHRASGVTARCLDT